MQELKPDDIVSQTERLKTSMQALQQQLTSLLKTQDQVLSSAGKMSSAYGDALKNLQQQISSLVKTEEKLITANEKAKASYKEATKAAKKYEDAIEDVNKEVKKGTERVAASTSAFDQNKEAVNSLKNNYKDLSKSLDEHQNKSEKLTKQTGDLTGVMKGQKDVLAETKESFEFQEKIFEGVDNSLESIKEQAGGYEDVVGSLQSGFKGLSTGIDLIKTGFQSIGGAVKATGFGLLMLVIESLTEYFTTDKIGIKQLRGGLAAIGVVTGKIKALFKDLGGIIVDALSHPAETVKKIWNAVVENFSNRFKALGVILDGVMHLDTKKIANGVIQLSTGVTNATDKLVNGFKRVKEELVKTGKEMVVAYDKAYADSGKKVKGPVGHRKVVKLHRDTEILSGKSVDVAEHLKSQKEQYDAEVALLNEQLEKKLVTQEEYNKKSEALQNKYHDSLGDTIKTFADKQMSNMLKQLDEINAGKRKLLDLSLQAQIKDDEKTAGKALLPGDIHAAEKKLMEDKYQYEIFLANGNTEKIKEIEARKQKDLADLDKNYQQQRKDFALNTAQQVADKAFSIIGANVKSSSEAKIKGLEKDKASELNNKSLTQTQRKAIEEKYKKKEDQEKLKAFKAEQRMSILQAVVNGALAITKVTAQTGVFSPLVIPGIIASTALQIATIVAQKPPQFAKGGYFRSDGRGAVLPGYSRTDNTNAYLRSGEAVVVSEAMRNPWARNLVSAINVAHGGRDFSVPNTSRGYAVGGLFTDGGNANRYYSQPMNDTKDLANTLAYQMINNFPPIYVDVKDVNNQQSILAQTINRVNL